MDIGQRVKETIACEIGRGAVELDKSVPLCAAGLTSLGLMRTIIKLERELGFQFDDDEMGALDAPTFSELIDLVTRAIDRQRTQDIGAP